MHTAWSASRTCSASRSAVEYTATASQPSSCSARITRTAISPRFATSTLSNTSGGPLERVERAAVDGLELEQELAVLDGAPVRHVDLAHDALNLRLDLVHELHRLEDAERLPDSDSVALLHERGRAGLRRAIERPDHRRLDPNEPVLRRGRGERRRLGLLQRRGRRHGSARLLG